jgi:murein DD-endopeptidase MepM/ murein hydrolase activator NlpD
MDRRHASKRPAAARTTLRSRRQFLGLLASTPLALAGAACLGSDNPEVQVTVDGGNLAPPRTGAAAAEQQTLPAAVPFTPAAPPSDLDPDDLHGFVMPIEGACLPSSERLMPNAPREYRMGVHEGVDFYWGDSCVLIERGTRVLAAYAGVIVRADHDYRPLTLEEVTRLRQETEERGTASEEALDRYRGRQVWIGHGNGVITRYCHLASIPANLAEGVRVEQGDVVGGVGESGTPRSLTAPGTELHLHWEVRVQDSFLGEDLDPDTVRSLYHRLFEPKTGA